MARLQDFNTVTPTSADKLLVVQSQGQGLVPYGSKLDSANPTGAGSLSLNRKANTTVGEYSAVTGLSNEASGNYAHAEGLGTIANRVAQHTFGSYNVADTTGADETVRGSYIEIVGNGVNSSNRSNARTLDWSGNEVLAGNLTIQGNVSLGLKTYEKAINGVTYDLYMMGQIGVLTIKTGSLTNAVSAGGELIALTDFSSDFTGKKFLASFQFCSTLDTTKRFDCANNSNHLITISALAAGTSIRGCVPVVIG